MPSDYGPNDLERIQHPSAASPFPIDGDNFDDQQVGFAPPGLPASMPYGNLSARKPSTDREHGYIPEIWRELDLLYRGGYAIQKEAAKFLHRCVRERQERWEERQKLAAYIGYLGQIVGVYAASLFSSPVSVVPAGDADDPATPGELPDADAYGEFAKNADLKGASFAEVLRAATTTALVKGKTLIGCDFPTAPDGANVVSRADSDNLGLARPYCFEVLPEELTDWEYDEVLRRRVELRDGDRKVGSVEFEFGRFSWVVLRTVVQRRSSPSEPRQGTAEEFKIWVRGDDGVVRWAIYRTQPLKEGQKLPADAPVARMAFGETQFKEIPLVEIRLPDPLWLGNVIGPLNKEHWQRRSALLSAQQRSLLVIPLLKLGKEISEVGGALPAEVQQDPARGHNAIRDYEQQGYTVLGSEDDLDFKGPPTDAYTVVDQQLKDLVDEIHRVSGRMAASVSSTSNAVGRSGASKAIDNADFVTVLRALGAIISDGARRIYEVIADARGDDAAWTVHGLDEFDVAVDREALVKEAAQMSTVGIKSTTFRKEYGTRIALQLLPGLSPETQAQIKAEIAQAVEDAEKAAAELQKKMATAPPKPEPDGDEGNQGPPPDGDAQGAPANGNQPPQFARS